MLNKLLRLREVVCVDRRKLCSNRISLVILVWAWMFLGSILTALSIAYVKGVPATFSEIIDMFNGEPYLASYVEVVAVGGLPLALTILCRDGFKVYGLTKAGLLKSVAASIPLAIAVLLPRVLYGGLNISSFNLRFPYNVWYALLGFSAYGPLEVFFTIWLIVNTDIIFHGLEKVFSPGLLITVLIFGLSHVFLSPQAGIVNAIHVAAEWLISGLIFKYTKNSIGLMIAWTLINGQVAYLVTGCLT
ncbi:MAG: hypothetical protein B6U65_02855 [Candidatus Wolframiiraptor sp. EX4484-121]|nr:MAG: hypothetical protein B6U65_02855 [Candidatus Wolframiiraptor sp. EX4484-121]